VFQHKVVKILLLAVIVYFVNIRISTLNAAEKEKSAQEDAGSLRDPFISVIDVKTTKGVPAKEREIKMPSFPMVLKGVMLQAGNSVAIINEDIVKEGQIWRDFKVERIDSQGVTLNYRQEILRLQLQEEQDDGLESGVSRDDFVRSREFDSGGRF
jgi:hypothetical protein